MKKFDDWNKIKQKTQKETNRFYTVREVWWCRLGINIGSEQDGKGEWFVRPVVILRGFGPDSCLVVPLTTSSYQHFLRIDVGIVNGKPARGNLSQIRVVDTKRLEEKIGFLDKEKFSKLRKTIKKML